jgi:hypothetical protein
VLDSECCKKIHLRNKRILRRARCRGINMAKNCSGKEGIEFIEGKSSLCKKEEKEDTKNQDNK